VKSEVPEDSGGGAVLVPRPPPPGPLNPNSLIKVERRFGSWAMVVGKALGSGELGSQEKVC